ncbi:hypothetical protein [Niabella hibiscisoli]|uniref:hypothetical protein n=1 Tax=Niabella hibiscisoli TaxID=1825928 RepID=UPI001F0F4F58|nr:hypothetical protein [Niabella hibiscisoli]MCH5719897.1 hypothetical protein [Niabella hibiscisoli]
MSVVKQRLKDNRELYKQYIPFAENFAYADFDWTEVVLVDRWKDDIGKERLAFTNGKSVEFVIGKNRFEVCKQSELGQIVKFKLHKQVIKKEVEHTHSRMGKKIVTAYKYIPLVAEASAKRNWAILDDAFAVVDYFNKEKNIIHAITTDNKEVFFPQIMSALQIGDFITAKSYTKKVKEESRTELKDIRKIDKDSVISKFQTQIALVDGVNAQKQLFHFVLNQKLQGIIKYSETSLRPAEGDFIQLSYVTKIDKDKKLRVIVVNIESTEETNANLRKDITGLLEVKYKDHNYDEDIPDFAFIGDYYVPKYLLEKHNIVTNCKVNARAIYAGGKWKVVGIEKLN